jgi:acetyl-CoA carboxylase carboxyltransferase component
MPMNVMSTLVGIEIAVTRVERTESRKTRMTREEEAQQALLRERLDRLLDERRLIEHGRERRAGRSF